MGDKDLDIVLTKLLRFLEELTSGTATILESTVELEAEQRISEYPQSRLSLVEKSSLSCRLTAGITATVVVKTTTPQARHDLLRQVETLLNIPPQWSAHFPEVLGVFIEADPPKYVMRFYPHPSLRNLILAGSIDGDQASAYLTSVFDFLFREVYQTNVGVPHSAFVNKAHLHRMRERLGSLSKTTEHLGRLVAAATIRIGESTYQNILPLLDDIERDSEILRMLRPGTTNNVHGDLELDHILVNFGVLSGPRFVLLDPRLPEEGSDVAYDLGKLWQSVDGLLDLIAGEKFDLAISSIGTSTVSVDRFNIRDPNASPILSEIASTIPSLLSGYPQIANDPTWFARMAFCSAAHICSAGPFYLTGDGRERVATALYLRAVELLNRFVEEYG